jgi:O-6-methylguanine DNA methyltransferase
VTKVVALLENPAGVFLNHLDIQGGDFEQLIWAAVRSIPPGKSKNATEIAREIIAGPSAKECVLKICRDSNLAVVIPTHRLAESDGSGSGFAWGEDKRMALLAREGGSATHLNVEQAAAAKVFPAQNYSTTKCQQGLPSAYRAILVIPSSCFIYCWLPRTRARNDCGVDWYRTWQHAKVGPR